MQGFDYYNKIFNKFIELCERINKDKEIFYDSYDVTYTNKKTIQSSSSHQKPLLSSKGSNQNAKTSKEDTEIYKINKNKFNVTCPLYGTEHNMNAYKIMRAQIKPKNAIWLSATWGRFCVNFSGTKKLSDHGEDLNTLVASAVVKYLKMKKMYKSKDAANSN